MRRVLRFLEQSTDKHPSAVCIVIAFVTLSFDFATGRDIRFPLLYVVPIGLAAWLSKRTLAYALSILLPTVRISFETLWGVTQFPVIESTNALIEVLALALYVHLAARKAAERSRMKNTIRMKDEEIEHFRSFARTLGTTLQGRSVSPGLADGIAFVYAPKHESALNESHIGRDRVGFEVERFNRALAASISELDTIRTQFEGRRTDDEIDLVEMRLAMLKSFSFSQECRRRVSDDLVTAEQAVMAEVQVMEARLHGLQHAFMRERSADLRDLGHQVLQNLRPEGKEETNLLAVLPRETILVAEELLLFDALRVDFANVAGIVTEKTGPASHVAILARIRGIPAVCDITDATLVLKSGDRLLVDAGKGAVTVAPTRAQAADFAERRKQSTLFSTVAPQKPLQLCSTKDGVRIGLHANISRPDEATIVLEHRLDGVGLFRSEFLFLAAEEPPDLKTQTAVYSEVASVLDPHPVIIRTMDIGGDKMPRFEGAANLTALRSGLRGLAYSLAEKKMFRTQIIAILRAAQRGNVRIMFPMVMGAEDLREARHEVEEASQKEHLANLPPIGAMIETPAAVFDIDKILQIADFVCIGTNDLAHSILTMDRATHGDDEASAFLHPSVLRATDLVVRAAVSWAVPLSVCGEAASDPAVACLLAGMGVRNLSMNPFLAARVCHALGHVTIEQTQDLAKQTLGSANPTKIREIVRAAAPGDSKGN